MANPISDIVAANPGQRPPQDDPAHYEWWAEYHEREAEKLVTPVPGETDSERLGRAQGEMDHRATAMAFREKAQDKDQAQADGTRRTLVERGVAAAPFRQTQDPNKRREEVIEDVKDAFRDYGIPEDLAGHAVTIGGLTDSRDAGDREAFVVKVLDTKRGLDDLVPDKGSAREVEGINDWKSAIEAAAARQQKAEQPVSNKVESASKVRSGLQTANAHWSRNTQDTRLKYPLLSSDQEALKIARAGERRAWLISKIPSDWQSRLGLSAERTYNDAVERAYQKLVDKKADILLAQRSKALDTLRGVDTRMDPHLLPSRQYRAAEKLTRIDQELRRLRPLPSAEYGAAIDAAKGQARAESVQRKVVEGTPALTQSQAHTPTSQRAPTIQSEPTKHQRALQTVREIQAQVPVDGYRTKAAEAMAKNIIRQLQEGRSTVALSAKYAGGDQGQANTTHANAVEANKELIEAVRQNGIAVDTGKATLAMGKKPEVELNSQVERDLAVESLQ